MHALRPDIEAWRAAIGLAIDRTEALGIAGYIGINGTDTLATLPFLRHESRSSLALQVWTSSPVTLNAISDPTRLGHCPADVYILAISAEGDETTAIQTLHLMSLPHLGGGLTRRHPASGALDFYLVSHAAAVA